MVQHERTALKHLLSMRQMTDGALIADGALIVARGTVPPRQVLPASLSCGVS